MKNEIRPTHIIWATHNRNHWERVFIGTLEECEKEMQELASDGGYGYEIHENEIKDSWNNPCDGIHYDTYMDDSTESRPMTAKEK